MRPTIFSTEPILRLFRRSKIATLDQLSDALGSASPITVFRKLDQLHYRTSYSHRGRYYTLDRIARFDDIGLWSHDAVWFSRFGTLVDTAAAFVNRDEHCRRLPQIGLLVQLSQDFAKEGLENAGLG